MQVSLSTYIKITFLIGVIANTVHKEEQSSVPIGESLIHKPGLFQSIQLVPLHVVQMNILRVPGFW